MIHNRKIEENPGLNLSSWIAAVEKDPKDYQKELLADYQEFTDLVTEAKAIVTDTDARYAAFVHSPVVFAKTHYSDSPNGT